MQDLVRALPEWRERRAVGLRGDYGTRWWSYKRLHANVLRAAAALQRRHLKAGDRIVLWSANCPEWIAYFLGAMMLGLVVTPVDASATADEAAECARRVNAKAVLCGNGQEWNDGSVASERIAGLERAPAWSLDAEKMTVPLNGSDAAVILFTAGTTGVPSGVVLTHENLVCQLRHFSYWRPVVRMFPTTMVALSPLSHVQGLMLSACVPLWLGLSVVHTHSIEPEHVQRTVRRSGARLLSTVPRVLALLEQALRHEAKELRLFALWSARRRKFGWQFHAVLVGGAALPEATESFWRHSGCIVVQGYGATETTAFTTVNRPLFGKRGSIGLAVHRSSVELSDEGEILVRGPHIGVPLDGVSVPANGFLHTGDLARRDKHGRFFFLGRKDERIVTSEGHTLHPQVIELVLRAVAGVDDAVVHAVATEGLEQVHATLLLREQGASAQQIVEKANAALPASHRIRSWTVWPHGDFPRGALEKVQRAQVVAYTLRQRAQQAMTADVPLHETVESALAEPDHQRRLARLHRLLRAELDDASFDQVRAVAEQLGLDSIDAAAMMTLLHEDSSGRHVAPLGVARQELSQATSVRRKAPEWQTWPGMSVVQASVRWLLFRGVTRHTLRVRTHGRERLARLRHPFIVVLCAEDREHYVDWLVLLAALPTECQRYAALIVGDRPALAPYFFRRPEDSRFDRFRAAFMARAGISCLAPFVLSTAGTVQGLRDVCRMIEKGYSPMLNWNAFAAACAADTGVPVVPVRIAGSRTNWRHADMDVVFGDAIENGPDLTASQLLAVVDLALHSLGKFLPVTSASARPVRSSSEIVLSPQSENVL